MDAPPTSKVFALQFLTDRWEWDQALAVADAEAARAMAKAALETLVRDEGPELACVTLTENGVKRGVWDWVEGRPYWTWF